MNTPIATLLAVTDIGGKLAAADNDALRMLLPPGCPPALKAALRAHKSALLALLRANFLVIRSDALDATVFWTPDDANRETLIAAGADPGSIYTADELANLVNRRVTSAELPGIHAAKGVFRGKVR